MSWCVNQIQDVRDVSVRSILWSPRQTDGLRLNRDAAFALDVHAVEVLRSHVAGINDTGELQHAVGQGGFTVVNMRDDAEVAQQLRRGGTGLGRR